TGDEAIAPGLYLDRVKSIQAHGEGEFHLGFRAGVTVDDGVALQSHLGDGTWLEDGDSGRVVVIEVHRPIDEAQPVPVDQAEKFHAVVGQGNRFDVDRQLARVDETGPIVYPVLGLATPCRPAAQVVSEILGQLYARAGANRLAQRLPSSGGGAQNAQAWRVGHRRSHQRYGYGEAQGRAEHRPAEKLCPLRPALG